MLTTVRDDSTALGARDSRLCAGESVPLACKAPAAQLLAAFTVEFSNGGCQKPKGHTSEKMKCIYSKIFNFKTFQNKDIKLDADRIIQEYYRAPRNS